jgi:hypothetical protein
VEIPIKESLIGLMTDKKDLANSNGKVDNIEEIFTQDTGKMVSNMVKADTTVLMVLTTLVNFKNKNYMVGDTKFLILDINILVSSSKTFATELVYTFILKMKAQFILDNGRMIRKMDTEFIRILSKTSL